jgi:hypothetical protein
MNLAATATRAELATFLGVGPSTISRWAKLGVIPGPLKGTRRYATAAVLDRLRHGSATDKPSAVESAFDKWVASRGQR